MPMLDAYIPSGALAPEDEHELLARLTDILLEHEGADPTNAVARDLAKVWLHRPAALFHAGQPATQPHYKIVCSVPEGQFDDQRRAGMVRAVTEAVIAAERGRYDDDSNRVWVFPTEVPEGTWGGGGRIARLADIVGLVMGDPGPARAYAQRRLSARQPAPV
jgi:phenylpyruvate tautomerase PptA (4-oxalocrotonate tautomerase family)